MSVTGCALGCADNPLMEVVLDGDDAGTVFSGQVSIGKPGYGSELVVGEGDSYPVDLAFHCDISDTSGLTLNNATDISDILKSDSGSTTGLFGGNSQGKYIIIGSDFPFGGVKVKISTAGIIEPENIIAEYLKDNSPLWVDSPFMSTDADFPYRQKAWNIATEDNKSEQWRFGFDRDDLPTTWDKVSLTINGVDYNKYWARFRIVSSITSDAILEQMKQHTNRAEINSDGTIELFGRARSQKTLFFGVQNLINNTVSSPANQDVTYESSVTVADYNDNQFNNNTEDSSLITQAVEVGLDTSIPIYLDISYYVEGTGTGDVEWQADVYKVTDGFVYDGSATPDNYSVIDSILSNSNLKRRTATIKILVNDLTDLDSFLIKIKRNASSSNLNDTLEEAVVITQVRLNGYFWKL